MCFSVRLPLWIGIYKYTFLFYFLLEEERMMTKIRGDFDSKLQAFLKA